MNWNGISYADSSSVSTVVAPLPRGWQWRRLKYVAEYFVSSVNKVLAEDEVPVRLCNYTDVYNNDEIRLMIEFMRATATAEEIKRFGLRTGDIVITKDSEHWSDIAVPALVVESADDLVCGYHLAVVRPDTRKIEPVFLFRVLQSPLINYQFQVAATGVTRYGLPKSAIGSAWIPCPPLDIQAAIADFLGRESDRLARLVGKDAKLIDLLHDFAERSPISNLIKKLFEYHRGLITAAITGQIDVRSYQARETASCP